MTDRLTLPEPLLSVHTPSLMHLMLSIFSYRCIAVKRHHDQGNLERKAFNWERVYVFSQLITVAEHAAARWGRV